ncbi:hypothetical protein HY224_03235 [Candidatus Uhrbacteria bacterium]|nr:hypothetical protein [Candidatus Uhrbacteria bacterium]
MKTTIILKADKAVKESAQRTAKDLGLTLSAVINASLKQFVRSREVYFSAAPKMTPELEKLVRQAGQDYKNKRNISPMLNSAKEATDYLRAK